MAVIELAGVALAALLSENFVLVSCMGIGTRLRAFQDPIDALRTGYCLTAVMVLSALLSWLADFLVLTRFGWQHFRLLFLCLLIPGIIAGLRLFVRVCLPELSRRMDDNLASIGTNCAALGCALLISQRSYGLGSALVCGRIAERLMRLCFLYCRQYAPYSKWFGTAFQKLPIPQEIKEAIFQAVKASSISQREEQLVLAQHLLAKLHNSLHITPPVSDEIQSYFNRDIKVIYADRIAHAVQAQLEGTPLAQAPLIGTLSQISNFTNLYENVSKRDAIQALYQA